MTEDTIKDTDTADEREPKPAAPVDDSSTNEVAPTGEGEPEAAPEAEPALDSEPEHAEAQPEPKLGQEGHGFTAPEPTSEMSGEGVAEAAPASAAESLNAEPVTLPAAEPEAEATVEPEPAPEDAPKPAKKTRTPKAPKTAAATTAPAPDATPTTSVTPGEEPTEPKPENKKKWYAVKVQSGREDTIKAAIMRKVAIEGLEEYFGQIMVPVEEVIEKKQVRVKDKKTGEYTYQEKKVTKRKKKFHGYIFAEVEFNDRILYLFRETSGVGDFLNVRGTPPMAEPMPEHEVQQMLTGEKSPGLGGHKKVKLEFEKGDRVRIKEGSFANSEGEVKAISEPKDPTDPPKITVVVTFWGRPLDVELDWYQVVKV